ncbi:hypothetical protein AB8B02_28590 [Tardiphaga sp. 862_B3_N4_1]|uniref:hypothetical protein n=1 Tax=Tardiphaga sp. 862_B3_N4_1 TaxID=3240764 RepID=UPI003F1E6C58
MKTGTGFLLATAMLSGMCSFAEAQGGGRFLSSLIARGGAAAVRSSASGGATTYIKTYGADVLSVAQLTTCIKKATKLDSDSDRIEASRASIQELQLKVQASNSSLESQRNQLDRRSKLAVNKFNASIDRHNEFAQSAKSEQLSFNSSVDVHNGDIDTYNAECAKKYYADDLAEAQKIAAAN